jgi:N-hydroxyarylamine O-acetyltransferase
LIPKSDILINLEDEFRTCYLQRIGFSVDEVNELISSSPNLEKLQRLLSAHIVTVPFENMDQHEHPPHEEYETPLIPRRNKLPSLDVTRSLEKIVFQNRGGFCFELNFSFRSLLSSLGYTTRLALADVTCDQPVPGHVVILVDGLMDVPVLVDVGFGDPGVCNVLLPVKYNSPKDDSHGDSFEFHIDDLTDRFDTRLCRTRVSNSAKDGSGCDEEKMYRFKLDDDMEMTAAEFYEGLDRVLTTSPTFTGKRICVLSNSGGHVTLGRDYIKWVEKGESVRQIELPNETLWRAALKDHFGITLNPENN